ncbi:MAG: C2H2-type zinc finger protein [Nitrososphaerales archaeon]
MSIKIVHFALFAKKHKCKDCATELPSYEELMAHARKEHKRPILKCKICHKEFVYESERWQHLKEAHKKS